MDKATFVKEYLRGHSLQKNMRLCCACSCDLIVKHLPDKSTETEYEWERIEGDDDRQCEKLFLLSKEEGLLKLYEKCSCKIFRLSRAAGENDLWQYPFDTKFKTPVKGPYDPKDPGKFPASESDEAYYYICICATDRDKP